MYLGVDVVGLLRRGGRQQAREALEQVRRRQQQVHQVAQHPVGVLRGLQSESTHRILFSSKCESFYTLADSQSILSMHWCEFSLTSSPSRPGTDPPTWPA